MSDKIDNRFIWVNGGVVRLSDATINVLSPTSQFGLNVFEGIRSYWSPEKQELYAFRLDDHFRRLKKSQRLLQLDDTFAPQELLSAFLETVRANEYREDIAVRMTLFVDGFGSWSSTGPVNMFISPIPKAKTSAEYNKKGLNCCISSWTRIDDGCLSPRIKCGANYINSRMAQREALKNGYDTTIFLNKNGKVAEGPGSCLFIVKDGVIVTPLLTDSVLESITRDTLIKLAAAMGYRVEERSIDRTELYTCDEAFLCGSAMEVTAVNSVDRYVIGDGCSEGPVTNALHHEYLKVVTGDRDEYSNWLTPIYG